MVDDIVGLADGQHDYQIECIASEHPPQFVWSQDSCIITCDDVNGQSLMVNVGFNRPQDLMPAFRVLANRLGISIIASEIHLSGGNILAGQGPTIVGIDCYNRILDSEDKTIRDFKMTSFWSIVGNNSIMLGGSRSATPSWRERLPFMGRGLQPLFHIDMYVTRTGVVGASGREVVFMGRPSMAKQVVGRAADHAGDWDAFDALFDESEEALSDTFEVRHLPLFISKGRLGLGANPLRTYPLSYNNCIVECDGESTRRVLCPSFLEGSQSSQTDPTIRTELDQFVTRCWKELGFSVQCVGNVEGLAFDNGGIRCLVNRAS